MRVDVLARRIGATPVGISPLSTLAYLAHPDDARCGDLTFNSPRSGHPIEQLPADIVCISQDRPHNAGAYFRVDDINDAVARAAQWLPLRPHRRTRSAHLHKGIASTASVAATAVVAPGAEVGACSTIAAGVVIDAETVIGDYCEIGAGSVLRGATQLGNRVRVGAGCVIGDAGFAYLDDGQQWLRMPHFGGVVIEDDVEICAQVTLHAGVYNNTRIGAGSILDSQVLIGHDVHLGRGCALAGQVAVAGAARLGERCRIGGKAGIGEGVSIADGVMIAAMTMVSRSIHERGGHYAGAWPAQRSTRWWRQVSRFRRSES